MAFHYIQTMYGTQLVKAMPGVCTSMVQHHANNANCNILATHL